MENASRALLMAAGILVGILILTLIAILFLAGNEVFTDYEKTKTSESIERFNNNFTKYVGQTLTAHQVLTISNFARNNGVTVVINTPLTNTTQISTDISGFSGDNVATLKLYHLQINSFSDEGYVNKITINS